MNKLIVVSTALISITLLSGCKSVVVHHGHSPAVVVDSRHYHERRDVHVIRHEPVAHHPHGRVRDVPHRSRPHASAVRRPPVASSSQAVREGHFKNHVVQQSRPTPPRREHTTQPPARHREHQRNRHEEQRPSPQRQRADSRQPNAKEKQQNRGRSDNRRKDAPRGKGNDRGRADDQRSDKGKGKAKGLKEQLRHTRFGQ